MKLTFTLYDVQEISSSAYRAFISTFRYQLEEFDSDFNSDNSDSDLSDFDQLTIWDIDPIEKFFKIQCFFLISDFCKDLSNFKCLFLLYCIRI